MDNANEAGSDRPIRETDLRRPGILQVSLLFSITIILFILIGYRVQAREFYSGILITEFGLMMLPALLFLLIFRFKPKDVLRLNGTKPVNFLLTFGVMLFAIPLAGVFNLLNLLLVNGIFGKIVVQPIPAPNNGAELLCSILAIAGSAGICEEFLFRGVIQRGFERSGHVKAILITAFLFGLTHLDFQKLFGTFFLGALIGLIVYRTNSLYCGMFAHFTNNAVAVLASYVSARLSELIGKAGGAVSTDVNMNELFSAFAEMPPNQLILVLFIYGFMLLFALILFTLLIYLFLRVNPAPAGGTIATAGITDTPVGTAAKRGGASSHNSSKGLLGLLPGLLMIAVIFFVEVRGFMGAGNWFTNLIRRILGV